MTPHRTRAHLRELAWLVILIHVAIVGLDLGGRATYPGEAMLGLMASSPLWWGLHGGCAVAGAVSVLVARLEWLAMSASTAVLGAWGVILLAYRWGATPPLPLLSPVLTLVVAALACWLAHYWIEQEG